MPKKKFIETHGKVEEPKTQPTMLEQIWGYNELAKYGTMSEAEYTSQINQMNRSDLEAHARRHGVVVVEYTPRLREKLIGAFRTFVSSVRPSTSETAAASGKELKVSEEVKRILAEGR